mmetsp:Transcript_89338/g.257673  ORF Transcript_89338/g.257673 Transcript_89338/m.257673 type:complete len:991 (+) Transcript_89338:429-3401(+)
MQVLPRLGPSELLAHCADALHPAAAVVQVAVGHRDLAVHWQQQPLAREDLLSDVGACSALRVQVPQGLVGTVHHLEDVAVLLEDDFGGRRRLQDAAPGLDVGEHLHLLGVDLGVKHHPSAAAQLAVRGDIDGHWVAVFNQCVHDHGAVLQHLGEHVACAPGEAAPVREDHQRQVLAAVEVADGLRGLVGGVGIPDLAGLRLVDVVGLAVRRVCRDVALHGAGLHGHDADREPAHAPAADDHRLAPALHVLPEGALVAEARAPLAVDHGAGQHVPGIIRRLRRHEPHQPRRRIPRRHHRRQGVGRLGDVRQPPQDGLDAIVVIGHELVRHAIGHHDVGATQLVLRRIHLLAQQLVQRLVARQDHGTLDHLDVPLAQTVQVCADADAPPSDIRKREGLLVGPARLARDQAAALQALDTDAALGGGHVQAEDRIQDVPDLPADRHRVRPDGVGWELGHVGLLQIQVVEALEVVAVVGPSNLDQRLKLFHSAEAGARIARDVHPRYSGRPCHGGRLLEELVLRGAEGARLDGHVIADEHDVPPGGVLRGAEGHLPHDHADLVPAVLLSFDELASLKRELLRRDELRRDPVHIGRLQPELGQRRAEEHGEIVDVRRAGRPGDAVLRAALGLHGRPDELERRERLLRFQLEVGGRAARVRVGDLLERRGLPTHGGVGQQPQRRRRGRGEPDLELDAGDAELQGARPVLGHAALHGRREHDLEVLDVALRGAWQRRHVVEEQLRGRVLLLDGLVEVGALDRIEGGKEVAHQHGLQGVQARGEVGRAPREDDLCLLVQRGTEIDGEDPPVLQGRQGELALQLGELDQVGQRRAHVAVLRDLRPTGRLLEMQVGGHAAHVPDHDAHAGAPFGVQGQGEGLDERRGAANDLLEGLLLPLRTLVLHRRRPRYQDVDLCDLRHRGHRPRLLEGLEGRGVGQDHGVALPHRPPGARGQEVPEQVEPRGRRALYDGPGLDSVDGVDAVAAVCPEQIQLRCLHQN